MGSIIVIYKDAYYTFQCVSFTNETCAVNTVVKYLRNIDIYDKIFQQELTEADNIQTLIDIINDYNIEVIHIYKVFDVNPKEIK